MNAQAKTSDKATSSAIVIVHGAWGGSWAFRRVDELLCERGCVVYRPSLTGQGERVHLATPDVGLRTHIDDVVNTILFENLHGIVLVGHSYGGMVISGVADRVPERIRRLVYIDAFVPNDGDSVKDLLVPSLAWVEPLMKNDFIVPPWLEPGQPPSQDVPQPRKTFSDAIALKNKTASQIPATYLLMVGEGQSAADADFTSQAARARQRGWRVRQLQSDHNPQWAAPEALVDHLAKECA